MNLVGKTYGRLIVIEKVESHRTPSGSIFSRWLCRCDCGNTRKVLGQHLRKGDTTSCGCLKTERQLDDLTGKRFGRLIVSERADDYVLPEGKKVVTWMCLCDCGETTVVTKNNIRSTKSCGCLLKESNKKRYVLPEDVKTLSRKEAKNLGQTRYYTGKQCPQGHNSERMVSSGSCVQCSYENKKGGSRYASERRAKQKEAMPSWLNEEQLKQIQEIYKERDLIVLKTGIPHHVDHIVPLKGESVSGLHVPWNLRVIPAKDNMVKSNKLVIT